MRVFLEVRDLQSYGFGFMNFADGEICGGKGIRTPDLLIANETLYQLSYTPGNEDKLLRRSRFSSSALPVSTPPREKY